MADRIIKMILTADTQGLVNGFRNATAATKDFGSKAGQYIDKNRDSINTASNALGLFGAAAVGAATLAVRKFVEFDSAMAEAKSVTKETAANMALLREAALDAGASTVYSASEAAAAITELGKAGLSTDAILSGGLAGALDLAASEGMDVAEAAELTATALSQFNLAGNKASHVADLLAAGAGKAQGSAADLGMALKQGGLVANQFGLTIEETAGGLALFAKQGLIGSDAGTSLKSMLTALANPSKESARLMEELGINAYDATGKFVGLDGLAGQLRDRLSGLTDAQRQQALAQIFGTDAMRAASVLYTEGADGVREMTDAVNDNGYAAEASAARLNTLAGDWEAFTGALETAMIGAGEGANGPLRDLVQSATDAVNAFSDLPSWVQQSTLLIVGGGGLVALGVAGLGKLAVSVRDIQVAMKSLNISLKSGGVLAGGIGAGLAVAAWIAQDLARRTREAEERIEAYADTLDGLGNRTKDTAQVVADALSLDRDAGETLMDWADRLGVSLDVVTDAIEGSSSAMTTLRDIEADLLQHSYDGGPAQARAADINNIIDAVEDEQRAYTDAQEQVKNKTRADEAAGIAQDDLAGATGQVTEAMQAQQQAAADLAEAQAKWIEDTSAVFDDFVSAGGPFQAVIDKNREHAEAAAENTESSTDSWEDFYDGQTVSSQDYISELTRQVEAQENWARNITELTARAAGELPPEMQGAVNAMMDELIRLGPEGAAQVQLLHDMTDDELREVVALYQRQGVAAGQDWASGVESARVPSVTVSTTAASNSIQSWIDRWTGFTISGTATIKTGPLAGMPAGSGIMRPPNFSGATGGYTGDGGKYDVAGIVHRGEYVLTKEATARIGVGRLDNWNYGQFPGYANGGAVGGSSASGPVTASLAPEDRALLRAVAGLVDRPVRLAVGRRDFALAVQDSSAFSARRGG